MTESDPQPSLPLAGGEDTPDAVPNRYSIDGYPQEYQLAVYVGHVEVILTPEAARGWTDRFNAVLENSDDWNRPCPDVEVHDGTYTVHISGGAHASLGAESISYSAEFTPDVLAVFAHDLEAAATYLTEHPDAPSIDADALAKELDSLEKGGDDV